ncbi:hypothetical protein [Oleispirillum naphthae]|uniref:hypothetical protein n=1 Tax=Oleispirillum naphthae TaxID=2838853 RepID=UPI0030822591
MALDIGSLTLYREKTLFFDGAHPGPDLEPYAKLAIRANRVTFALRAGEQTERIVVRGQNVPSTLRLSGMILDSFKADPAAFQLLGWGRLSGDALSDYDRAYMPESWFSLYANGIKLFSSYENAQAIDLVEEEAKGADVTEMLLKRLAPRLIDVRQVRLRHDSQAAIVMNENSDGVRCAVIERRRGKDAAYSFHVQNPPKKRIRLSAVAFMAADLFEIQNLYAVAERVAKSLAGAAQAEAAAAMSLDLVEAMQTRNLQLGSLVKAFHESHAVRYRPAPPAYLPVAARG